MSEHEKYQRVEPISGSDPKRKVELTPPGESEEEALSKIKFDKAVELADPSKVELRRKEVAAAEISSAQEAKRESLIDLARKTVEPPKVPPTAATIENQATSIRSYIERPRALLLAVGPNAPLDPVIDPTTGAKLTSQQVEAKLSTTLEHVDKALIDVTKEVTGVEVGSLIPKDKPPLVRFLKFLTESDKKLADTVKEVNLMNQTPEKLTPPKLLSIQIRMNFIQQELEFFAGVLNKALESTKTIMNVQI